MSNITLAKHGHKFALKDTLGLTPTAIARARVNPNELVADGLNTHVQLTAFCCGIDTVIDKAQRIGRPSAGFGKS
ncbi:hypothetical protein AQZ50_18545 [Novosphingobium sp. Fuku2-ISO-50]|nr:hypothetical protein AQZ50_18545 [Novosphingobium sp. Fuku2-ISO-50]